jgi:Aspartyl/Asparaginyl beta-hydroxylase
MIKYLQLPFYFDAALLQQEVQHLAANRWKLHYQTLHYEGEWSALPLRSIDAITDNIMISPQENAEYQDTIFLDECPYIKKLLQTFDCPLMAVRLLKLNAGAIIKEHRDHDLYFEKGEIRIHIPVITHEEVEIYLGKERLQLKEGECWYMNFNLPHAIQNNSPVNRIHLVIDARVNDWVKQLFAQPALYKKEIEEPGYDEATRKAMIVLLRNMNTETSNRMADKMEATLKYE